MEVPIVPELPEIPPELLEASEVDIRSVFDHDDLKGQAMDSLAALLLLKTDFHELAGAVKMRQYAEEKLRASIEGEKVKLNDVIEEETGERPLEEVVPEVGITTAPEITTNDDILDQTPNKQRELQIAPKSPTGRMWYLEIHTWSKEADGSVPGFFRAGPKAITRTYPRDHFKHNGECMLHNIKVTKPFYDRYKEANGDTRFGSTVFCELINMDTLTESSPYQAKWHTIGEHLLRQPRGLT